MTMTKGTRFDHSSGSMRVPGRGAKLTCIAMFWRMFMVSWKAANLRFSRP